MTQMPVGQYTAGNSVLHRMDASAKLISFFILFAAVVCTTSGWGYVFISGITAAVLALSRLPLSVTLGALRRMWVFFAIVFCMNALFTPSPTPLWSWWILTLSIDGFVQGAHMVLRVLLMLALGGVLTGTTPPMRLTEALAMLLRPLRWVRVPVDEVAMIIGIAIQFIPTLLEETLLLRRAQTARGAPFESKHLWQRIASVPALLLPTFLCAFRRADELSLAMEARGYRGARSTAAVRVQLRGVGMLAIFACILVCAAELWIF